MGGMSLTACFFHSSLFMVVVRRAEGKGVRSMGDEDGVSLNYLVQYSEGEPVVKVPQKEGLREAIEHYVGDGGLFVIGVNWQEQGVLVGFASGCFHGTPGNYSIECLDEGVRWWDCCVGCLVRWLMASYKEVCLW